MSSTHANILRGDSKELLLDEALKRAAALNCLASLKEKEPCNECSHCRQIRGKTFAALTILEPQGLANIIPISGIREVQARLLGKAEDGTTKVVVLQDAHRMSEISQNSLLKTLEEPPANSVLYLLTDRPRDLLPTVLSRCQIFDIKSGGDDTAFGGEAGDAAFAAEYAKYIESVEDMIYMAARMDYFELFEKAALLAARKKAGINEFLRAAEKVLRDDLADILALKHEEQKTNAFACIATLEHVWKAGYLLDSNVTPLLVMENLILNFKKHRINTKKCQSPGLPFCKSNF